MASDSREINEVLRDLGYEQNSHQARARADLLQRRRRTIHPAHTDDWQGATRLPVDMTDDFCCMRAKRCAA